MNILVFLQNAIQASKFKLFCEERSHFQIVKPESRNTTLIGKRKAEREERRQMNGRYLVKLVTSSTPT